MFPAELARTPISGEGGAAGAVVVVPVKLPKEAPPDTKLPPIGIGIATGETILGNFGSVRRLEYTAIGPHVNLSARLCGIAEGHQILISESTYAAVKDSLMADEVPPKKLRGIEDDVRYWSVQAIK